MTLRFHWRLLMGGETSGETRATMYSRLETGLPDLEAQINFCRAAEAAGIDSLLIDFGASKPDSILLATVLGRATEKIRFIIAYRSGLLSPTSFVQQLNTLSAFINGRFSLNIVAGYSTQEQQSYGDFLSHDERYERTDEFLAICRAFWGREAEVNFEGKYYRVEGGRLNTPFLSPDRTSPEILVAGSSPPAKLLALRQGSCWIRLADAPEKLRDESLMVSKQGIDVGLRMSIITRRTRTEATRAAYALVEDLRSARHERGFVDASDSKSIKATYELADDEWLNPYLWTGAVRAYGAPAIALVGTPEEVATAIMEYKAIGVSQFIFSGWPKLEEMIRFGRDVLPLVREKERALEDQVMVEAISNN
jgi:alkanesulfonate monooxygenase